MKSYIVHLMNCYPDCQVQGTEDQITVRKDNDILVCIRRNGAGAWVDAKDEVGALDAFDLSPIPKNARAWKLYPDGKVGRSEEFSERIKVGRLLFEKMGRVPTLEALKKSGVEIKDDGIVFAVLKTPETPKVPETPESGSDSPDAA